MVANIAQRGLPDYTGQSGQTGSGYALAIDAAMQVFARVARAFAPHASESGSPSAPDMTVTIDAGALLVGESLVSQNAQTSGTITAPSGNPRRDLIVIDEKTAALSIVTGTEAASPSDPDLPDGKIPVGRIRLTVGMTVIDDMDIDDLRPIWLVSAGMKGTTITPVVQSGSPTGCVITLPAIGDYFVVDFSGSPSLPRVIGISSRKAGARLLLRIAGTASFAHLGNLIMAAAEDKALADGDLIDLVSEGEGVWREVPGSAVLSTPVKQILMGVIAAASGTSTIPLDNTSPQSTEGTQIWSQEITLTSASNKVRVSFSCQWANTETEFRVIFALFRGTTCLGVLAPRRYFVSAGGTTFTLAMEVSDTPGSVGPHTYQLRVGVESGGGTWYINQDPSASYFNGEMAKNAYSIMEYE